MSQLTKSPCKWDFDKIGENVHTYREFLDKLGYNWWVGGLVINKDAVIFNNIFNDIFIETK